MELRLAAVAATLGLVLVLLLWAAGFAPFAADAGWLEGAPADALALVVIRQMPDSLEFLENSRLGRWFEREGLDEAPANLEESDLSLLKRLRDRIDGGWLALHRVGRKANGALRPHLSGLLRPSGSPGELQAWLETRIAERFGSVNVTQLSDGARLVEGSEPGQTLYMRRRGPDLLLSNSTEGWLRVQTGVRGRTRPVEPELIEALAEPVDAWDLLVYFRGPAPLELVPTFLYRLDFDHPEQDDYRPLGGAADTREIEFSITRRPSPGARKRMVSGINFFKFSGGAPDPG